MYQLKNASRESELIFPVSTLLKTFLQLVIKKLSHCISSFLKHKDDFNSIISFLSHFEDSLKFSSQLAHFVKYTLFIICFQVKVFIYNNFVIKYWLSFHQLNYKNEMVHKVFNFLNVCGEICFWPSDWHNVVCFLSVLWLLLFVSVCIVFPSFANAFCSWAFTTHFAILYYSSQSVYKKIRFATLLKKKGKREIRFCNSWLSGST